MLALPSSVTPDCEEITCSKQAAKLWGKSANAEQTRFSSAHFATDPSAFALDPARPSKDHV